jgi:hypothetical protein
MTTSSAERLLKDLGLDTKEATERLLSSRRNKVITKHICSCGHPEGRHFIDAESASCKPNAMDCSCSEYNPTLKVTDLRPFLQKSRGSGVDHALVKGLTSAFMKEVEVEWLGSGMDCKKCGTKEGTTIYILGGSESAGLQMVQDPLWGRWNYFLCEPCADNL